MRYKNLILAFGTLWVTGCSSATLLQENVNTAATDILVKQTNSWNKGDMAGFMNGYWKSDSLQFIGRNGITYGYNNTLQSYRTTYPDAASMGKLGYEVLSIKPIGSTAAYVTGRWKLERNVGNQDGYFTLLMRRFPDGWKIVADHSS